MIGLDTNVLVRLLVQDDDTQSVIAANLIASLSVDRPGFVSREVLIEFVWVLVRRYKLGRARAAEAVVFLLRAEELRLEHEADVESALEIFARSNVDLADILIAQAARRSGASELVTFDRRAASLEGVRLLEA